MGCKRWNVLLINALNSLYSQARRYNDCIKIWKLFLQRSWQFSLINLSHWASRKPVLLAEVISWTKMGQDLKMEVWLTNQTLDERHHHTQISFFLCLKISKNSSWCGCNIIQWLDSKDIYRERIVYVKINFEGALNFTWVRVNMVWVSFHLSRSSLQ